MVENERNRKWEGGEGEGGESEEEQSVGRVGKE